MIIINVLPISQNENRYNNSLPNRKFGNWAQLFIRVVSISMLDLLLGGSFFKLQSIIGYSGVGR